MTQLLDTLDLWTEALDAGSGVDAIYMDFRKAFDSILHCRLMTKVHAHGIRGNVHTWIQDFLARLTQCMVINGTMSAEASVSSGIPQGSVLGPILFELYINDLPRNVKNHVKLFADDSKIFARSDDKRAKTSLQADLDRLNKWSDDWQLRFHPEKCSLIRIGEPTVRNR